MFSYILNYLFGFLFFKKVLISFICLLLMTCFMTLMESKIMGSSQKSSGPNLIGFLGLFQPLADGIKLLLKELIIPGFSNKVPFMLSSLFSLILSIFSWYVIPFHDQYTLSEVRIGFIYMLTVISLGIYCMLISGWSSNSKFAIVGSIRSASQMISYEMSLGVIFILIFLCFGSVKLNEMILIQNYSFFIFFFIPIFYMFLVAQLAEINSLPFDLPEAEAELVSGYNVEYSGVSFVFFNIGEYLHNILLSNMLNIFFFGGWISPFFIFSSFLVEDFFLLTLKSSFWIYFVFFIRGVFLRYRYDQLMFLNWSFFVPILIYLFFFLFLFLFLL